jgi:hypothetical protein
VFLAIFGAVVFGLATLRFRRSLAPAGRRRHDAEPELEAVAS